MSIPLPPNVKDRLLTAIRKLIFQECPRVTYSGLWEYAVASVNDDGTVNGTPTDDTIPLPPLNNVPFAGLASGGQSKPNAGFPFLVEFGNTDGTKYVVMGAMPLVHTATLDADQRADVASTASNPLNLGPSHSRKVARTGDSLTIWFPLGSITGTLKIDPSTSIPIPPTAIQILQPAPGIITGGGERVRA